MAGAPIPENIAVATAMPRKRINVSCLDATITETTGPGDGVIVNENVIKLPTAEFGRKPSGALAFYEWKGRDRKK